MNRHCEIMNLNYTTLLRGIIGKALWAGMTWQSVKYKKTIKDTNRLPLPQKAGSQ